jgi:hypothetical protein
MTKKVAKGSVDNPSQGHQTTFTAHKKLTHFPAKIGSRRRAVEKSNIHTVDKMVAPPQQINEGERSAFAFLRDKWEVGRGCTSGENVCVGNGTLRMNLDLLGNNELCSESDLEDNHVEKRDDHLQDHDSCAGRGLQKNRGRDSSQEEHVKDLGIEVRVDMSFDEHEHDLAYISKKMQMLETRTSDDVVTITPVESNEQETLRNGKNNIAPLKAYQDTMQLEQDLSICTSKDNNCDTQGSLSQCIKANDDNSSNVNENLPPSNQENFRKKIESTVAAAPTNVPACISVDDAHRTTSKGKSKTMNDHLNTKTQLACERLYQRENEKRQRAQSLKSMSADFPISTKTPRKVPQIASMVENMKRVSMPFSKDTLSSSVSTSFSFTDELSDIQESESLPVTNRRKSSRKKNMVTCHRLYNSSKVLSRQEEGRQRRDAIARAISKRRELPVFSDETVPLSKASEFYKKSMKMKFEKERRLEEMKQAAVEKREKSIPKFNETIPLSHAADFYKKSMRKAHKMKERIEDKKLAAAKAKSEDEVTFPGKVVGTVPLSHASDFYNKSVRWAILEERRRALSARARKSDYEPLYKFNLMK